MQDASAVNTIVDMGRACSPAAQLPLQDQPGLPLPLKALRSAVAVATHGSAARAAPVVSKSATSITRDIQWLEKTLEMRLFERHPRGMAPTAAGRVLVAGAARALQRLECGATGTLPADAHGGPASQQRFSRFARLASARLLQVLIAIAETGSAALAGRRLCLSQAAVGQALRDLRHLAGAALVEPGARGVRLTETGTILVRRVKLAALELRIAAEEAASLRGMPRGRVTIASLPYPSVELVPHAATACLRRHPQIQVAVIDGTYDSLIEQLRSGDIDMIVGTLRPSAFDDVEQEPLLDDTLCVACRAGHPYAAMERLELGDVLPASWIAPLPGTGARTAFDAAFRSARLEPPVVRLEIHNPLAVHAVLLASDHLALLSVRQIRSDIAAGRLAALPIALRDARRPIGLTRRRDGAQSPVFMALRNELRAVAARIAALDQPARSACAAKTGTTPATCR